MKNQNEITEKMRAYLIDWIAELHMKFKLWPETLFVTVAIIDKYLLKKTNQTKKSLQLLGISALHIAGKYEEIYPPELKHLIRVTDNAITKEQVIQTEHDILRTLEFELTFPSALRFLERYARIAQVSEKTLTLANYFIDTSLLDCTLVKEKPSKVAAMAIYAAQKIQRNMAGSTGSIWNATMTKNTCYKEEELKPLAAELIQFVKNVESSSLKTMAKKYNLPKYLEVAKMLN